MKCDIAQEFNNYVAEVRDALNESYDSNINALVATAKEIVKGFEVSKSQKQLWLQRLNLLYEGVGSEDHATAIAWGNTNKMLSGIMDFEDVSPIVFRKDFKVGKRLIYKPIFNYEGVVTDIKNKDLGYNPKKKATSTAEEEFIDIVKGKKINAKVKAIQNVVIGVFVENEDGTEGEQVGYVHDFSWVERNRQGVSTNIQEKKVEVAKHNLYLLRNNIISNYLKGKPAVRASISEMRQGKPMLTYKPVSALTGLPDPNLVLAVITNVELLATNTPQLRLVTFSYYDPDKKRVVSTQIQMSKKSNPIIGRTMALLPYNNGDDVYPSILQGKKLKDTSFLKVMEALAKNIYVKSELTEQKKAFLNNIVSILKTNGITGAKDSTEIDMLRTLVHSLFMKTKTMEEAYNRNNKSATKYSYDLVMEEDNMYIVVSSSASDKEAYPLLTNNKINNTFFDNLQKMADIIYLEPNIYEGRGNVILNKNKGKPFLTFDENEKGELAIKEYKDYNSYIKAMSLTNINGTNKVKEADGTEAYKYFHNMVFFTDLNADEEVFSIPEKEMALATKETKINGVMQGDQKREVFIPYLIDYVFGRAEEEGEVPQASMSDAVETQLQQPLDTETGDEATTGFELPKRENTKSLIGHKIWNRKAKDMKERTEHLSSKTLPEFLVELGDMLITKYNYLELIQELYNTHFKKFVEISMLYPDGKIHYMRGRLSYDATNGIRYLTKNKVGSVVFNKLLQQFSLSDSIVFMNYLDSPEATELIKKYNIELDVHGEVYDYDDVLFLLGLAPKFVVEENAELPVEDVEEKALPDTIEEASAEEVAPPETAQEVASVPVEEVMPTEEIAPAEETPVEEPSPISPEEQFLKNKQEDLDSLFGESPNKPKSPTKALVIDPSSPLNPYAINKFKVFSEEKQKYFFYTSVQQYYNLQKYAVKYQRPIPSSNNAKERKRIKTIYDNDRKKNIENARKLMATQDPKQVFTLGRRDNIFNFSKELWEKDMFNIMEKGLREAIMQNEHLRTLLIASGSLPIEFTITPNGYNDIWNKTFPLLLDTIRQELIATAVKQPENIEEEKIQPTIELPDTFNEIVNEATAFIGGSLSNNDSSFAEGVKSFFPKNKRITDLDTVLFYVDYTEGDEDEINLNANNILQSLVEAMETKASILIPTDSAFIEELELKKILKENGYKEIKRKKSYLLFEHKNNNANKVDEGLLLKPKKMPPVFTGISTIISGFYEGDEGFISDLNKSYGIPENLTPIDTIPFVNVIDDTYVSDEGYLMTQDENGTFTLANQDEQNLSFKYFYNQDTRRWYVAKSVIEKSNNQRVLELMPIDINTIPFLFKTAENVPLYIASSVPLNVYGKDAIRDMYYHSYRKELYAQANDNPNAFGLYLQTLPNIKKAYLNKDFEALISFVAYNLEKKSIIYKKCD